MLPVSPVMLQRATGRRLLFAVPELTRRSDIKLNMQSWLQGLVAVLS